MIIEIYILILFIGIALILQDHYKEYLYDTTLSTIQPYNPNTPYNYTIENIYNESKHETHRHDFGVYYDKVDYTLFKINTTHNASIIKKSMFSESPYFYDYIQSNAHEASYILDCGCGTGDFSIYLANKIPNCKIVSFTNSPKCLEEARKNIKQHNKEKQITTLLLDFDNLNTLQHNGFDRIYFIESHGYSQNRATLFKHCKSLLRKNGMIYIRTPSFYNQYHKHLKDITNFWKYNFSTSDNICYDLHNCGLTCSYIEINAIKLFLSYDPIAATGLPMFMLFNSPLFISKRYMLAHILLAIYGMKFSIIKATA